MTPPCPTCGSTNTGISNFALVCFECHWTPKFGMRAHMETRAVKDEAKTAEQQNEYNARVVLADALNKLRANLGTAIRDLKEALEVLSNVEIALQEVPDNVSAESVDVSNALYALTLADDEWIEPLDVRSIQGYIAQAAGNLSEAVGQVDYLDAGDFSE